MTIRGPRTAGLVFAAALAAHACGGSASTSMNVTAPAGVRCQATVTSSSGSFGPGGGTGTVSVSVSRECAWQAVSQSPFIAITDGQEGQGDGTVTYRVAENADPVARQGALAVGERQVAISQAAAPCRFEVSPSADGPVSAQGGELRVDLRTHPLCDWSAASDVAWARVIPGSGRGDRTVRVEVDANTGAARAASIVVANERITVMQNAPAAPPPPPPVPVPPPPAPTPPPTPPPAPTPPTPPPSPPEPTPAPTPPEPTPVRSVRIEGRASSVSGSCPALTFKIRDQEIYTTSETRYDDGRCRDIRNGLELEVRGTVMSDGRIRADRVEID